CVFHSCRRTKRGGQNPAGQADGKREPDPESMGFAPRSLIRGRCTSVLICHLTLLLRSQAKNACAPQHRRGDFPVCLGKVKFCKASHARSISRLSARSASGVSTSVMAAAFSTGTSVTTSR